MIGVLVLGLEDDCKPVLHTGGREFEFLPGREVLKKDIVLLENIGSRFLELNPLQRLKVRISVLHSF